MLRGCATSVESELDVDHLKDSRRQRYGAAPTLSRTRADTSRDADASFDAELGEPDENLRDSSGLCSALLKVHLCLAGYPGA
jgi:hypothetical protein